jgi:hypothetical protein
MEALMAKIVWEELEQEGIGWVARRNVYRCKVPGGCKLEINPRLVCAPGFLCQNARQEPGRQVYSQAGAWERGEREKEAQASGL